MPNFRKSLALVEDTTTSPPRSNFTRLNDRMGLAVAAWAWLARHPSLTSGGNVPAGSIDRFTAMVTVICRRRSSVVPTSRSQRRTPILFRALGERAASASRAASHSASVGFAGRYTSATSPPGRAASGVAAGSGDRSCAILPPRGCGAKLSGGLAAGRSAFPGGRFPGCTGDTGGPSRFQRRNLRRVVVESLSAGVFPRDHPCARWCPANSCGGSASGSSPRAWGTRSGPGRMRRRSLAEIMQ